MIPQYRQWTIPSLLYQTRRKDPLVHKGFNSVLIRSNVVTDQGIHFLFTECTIKN